MMSNVDVVMDFKEKDILPVIYLKPGEIYFARDPVKIVTILGSCVSVIMYNQARRIGSICHAVMPSLKSAPADKLLMGDTFKFVDSSMDWMLCRFDEAGIKCNNIEVKLFGGAGISYPHKESGSIAVGRKNIEAAMEIIENKGLELKAWNVGGSEGRKLVFCTETGEVFTRYVGRTAATRVIPGNMK